MIVTFATYWYRRGKFVKHSEYSVQYGIIKTPGSPTLKGVVRDNRRHLREFFTWWNKHRPDRAVDMEYLFLPGTGPKPRKQVNRSDYGGKPIHTPYGDYKSISAASASTGFTPARIRSKLESEPKKWYLLQS